jgi:hypothetical protein
MRAGGANIKTMAQDDREQEQELLAGLQARTGRTLAEWMAAIAAQGFTDKNETIDWLRSQGLPFARASWLERIHSNDGQPIYQDKPLLKQKSREPAAAPAKDGLNTEDEQKLEKLIATAKGYRLLYNYLENAIRAAFADVSIRPAAGYISIGQPEFAAIQPLSNELRLGLDLGERPFDALVVKAKLKGAKPAISHMVVLTDARQVNADLIGLLQAASARVNG